MKATCVSSNLPLDRNEKILGRHTIIQRSALTGFRHHLAPQVLPALRNNAQLSIVREMNNPHDPDAVALYWRDCKLGYLPRGENFLVARLLERQRPLSARVFKLFPNAERNRRIRVEVLLH